MLVNKIMGLSKINFKGIQHVKNDVGKDVILFNYPYDFKNETCEVHIYKATPNEKYNYQLSETPVAIVNLKPEGVTVNPQTLANLGKNEPFAYKVIRKEKSTGKIIYEGADTGVKLKQKDGEYVFRVHQDKAWKDVKNGDLKYSYEMSNEYKDDSVNNYQYTLVTRRGTNPRVQGAGYLAIPDSLKPGVKYKDFKDENTGEIYFDEEHQKNAENTIKTFSNKYDGSLAALQERIPYLKQNGYKVFFTTPIANGDNRSGHGYWNKNNMQVQSTMGNTENFNSFVKDLYKNGMKYVYDGTFTSEGLEGIHFQYALRWADSNPQSYYWFRMNGLKNSSLGLGTVPENKENLRHRVVNAPYLYEQQSNGMYKKVKNPNYDANKETLFQIYDGSQISEAQEKDLDNAISTYENIVGGNELKNISHDDTLINYIFQIDPKELDKRIDIINSLNKVGKNVKLNTPEGTMLVAQFPNFRIDKKTEGGFVTWDANADMVKMNYQISGYDEKELLAIVDRDEREHEKQMIVRGTKEVQDMAIQAGKYWTGNVKDVQTIYTAKTIGNAKTVDALDKLIQNGLLPEEAKINNNVLTNILNAEYLLAPKGILPKDDITVKALMKMPLDALELGENTVGVLSTSYFSNRATTEETIGVSRFDLMRENDPHLVEPYIKNYKEVNSLFNNELKEFADRVIEKVNQESNEKLINSDGDYTEYGEYIIDLVGKDVTKYALLKAIAGEKLEAKISKTQDNEITYNYEKLQKDTSLKALGINAVNPTDEAGQLLEIMNSGLNKLSVEDVNFVADSIVKRIDGTDTQSFRLAEAIVDRASLGLDWRLDAAKDVMDQDAVRNGDAKFDDTWNDVIKFWGKFVDGVKTQNSSSYIVAEITDIPDLIKDTYGSESCPYNGATDIGQKFNGDPDAQTKLFNETGINSEAGYSYFFTNLLVNFAREFENGTWQSETHDAFKNRFDLLMQTRSVDYLRNLYTFMGNHDKPRMIHGMAVDMRLFHSSLLNDYKNFSQEHDQRVQAIKVLSGTSDMKNVPIEMQLNVDNNEYFRTVSARAVAMSKLIMDSVNEDLNGIAAKEDIELINRALVDLTNGNYLGEGKNTNFNRINIKELTDLRAAFTEVLKNAEKYGYYLSNEDKENLLNKVVENAKNLDKNNFLVHGDFDWTELDKSIKDKNNVYAKEILGDKLDYNSYSLYSIQLARLLKEASMNENGVNHLAINRALKDFAAKYNKEMVEANTNHVPNNEDTKTAMRKNGYAARDIKLAINMAIKQAEFISGKEIANKEQIIDTVYKSTTEPAVVKAGMIMEFLKGLPGIPTMYAGDELGMTGYEEKAKNIYLQNRNALPWNDLSADSIIGGYRNAVATAMNSTLGDRNKENYAPLNNGTPYALDVKAHNKNRDEVSARIAEINELIKINPANKQELENERRALTKDLAKIAYLMQTGNGDMTVTIFNAGDVDNESRVDYFAKYGLDTEEKRKKFFEENNIESINPKNKYIPILPKSEMDAILLGSTIALPVGTVFINANLRDKARYVVNEAGEIIKEGGGKIIMDGLTSKNGVMVLKKLLSFKGQSKNNKFYNTQYNIVSNPYVNAETQDLGKHFSVLSR